MNYEKKYNELVERIKEFHETGNALTKAQMEIILPELAESEDERVRKEIIAFLQSMNGYCNPTQDWDLRNRWLPYLEKQKEQQHNRELIRQSWYMEGYIDGKFKREPRWNLKTDEGGPRYEKNEKYGQLLEQEPLSTEETELNSIAFLEQMGYTCIPHGVKPTENGCEKIKNNCIHFLEFQKSHHADTHEIDECIAYLEKQKENPKTVDSIPSFCVSDVKWADTIITRAIVALADDVDYNRDEPCKHRREIDDLKELRDVLCEKKEQQSAEWSEEDEEALKELLDILSRREIVVSDDTVYLSKWFKSLRPYQHRDNDISKFFDKFGEIYNMSYDE